MKIIQEGAKLTHIDDPSIKANVVYGGMDTKHAKKARVKVSFDVECLLTPKISLDSTTKEPSDLTSVDVKYENLNQVQEEVAAQLEASLHKVLATLMFRAKTFGYSAGSGIGVYLPQEFQNYDFHI